jgi:hypothetical protein
MGYGGPSAKRTGVATMTDVPHGWTDLLSIALPPGYDAQRMAEQILRWQAAKQPYELTTEKLAALGMTEDDAQLAHDRALAGLVRAATGTSANAPSRTKDPIAHASYELCLKEPALIAAIRSMPGE